MGKDEESKKRKRGKQHAPGAPKKLDLSEKEKSKTKDTLRPWQ